MKENYCFIAVDQCNFQVFLLGIYVRAIIKIVFSSRSHLLIFEGNLRSIMINFLRWELHMDDIVQFTRSWFMACDRRQTVQVTGKLKHWMLQIMQENVLRGSHLKRIHSPFQQNKWWIFIKFLNEVLDRASHGSKYHFLKSYTT